MGCPVSEAGDATGIGDLPGAPSGGCGRAAGRRGERARSAGARSRARRSPSRAGLRRACPCCSAAPKWRAALLADRCGEQPEIPVAAAPAGDTRPDRHHARAVGCRRSYKSRARPSPSKPGRCRGGRAARCPPREAGRAPPRTPTRSRSLGQGLTRGSGPAPRPRLDPRGRHHSESRQPHRARPSRRGARAGGKAALVVARVLRVS